MGLDIVLDLDVVLVVDWVGVVAHDQDEAHVQVQGLLGGTIKDQPPATERVG